MSTPAVQTLKQIADTAARHNIPLELCGEMAGRPIEALALIGLGYKAISMPPAFIGPIKSIIRRINAEELRKIVEDSVLAGQGDLRDKLEVFMHSLQIED